MSQGLLCIAERYKSLEIERIDSQKTEKNFLSIGSPEMPIKWDFQTSRRLYNFLKIIQRPYRNTQVIPFEEPLKSAVKRFLISVDAYLESSNPVLTAEFLFNGVCQGPSFAEILKKERTKTLLNTFGGSFFEREKDEDLFGKERPYLLDIGDFFNYLYLIPWEEGDDEDWKYGLIDVKITEDSIIEFKQILEDILPDNVNLIEPYEVLMRNSGSRSLYNNVKSIRYKDKARSNKLGKKIGTGLRTIIPVGPKSYRDTVIIDSDALNRVNLIDMQTIEILQSLENHIMLRDESMVKKRIKQFSRSECFYIHRDMKKEGITKPRQLLKAMLEVLNKKYPNAEAFKETNFYDNFKLMIKDKIIDIERGHGLGMANALTTLMQIVIQRMISKRISGIYIKDYDFITLNDDLTVRVDCEEAVDEYWEFDDEVLKSLSIIRSPEKSFVLEDAFVIAEKYWSRFNAKIGEKESYARREVMMSLAMPTIGAAKVNIDACSYHVESRYIQAYLKEIITHWGYEFFPDEYKYPSWCGGWFTNRIEGIDLGLLIFQDVPYKKNIKAAYEACKHSVPIFKLKKMHKKYNIIGNIFKNVKIPERFNDVFDIGDISQIKMKYIRLNEHPKLWKIAWEGLNKKRKNVYLDNLGKQEPFEAFTDRVILESMRDFYPLQHQIKNSVRMVNKLGDISNPYVSVNARVSAISKWGNFDISPNEIREDFSINFLSLTENSTRGTSDIRKRMKQFQGEHILEFVGALTHVYFESDEKDINDDFQNSYINPEGVAVCAGLLTESALIPILKENLRNDIIKSKREVYGRMLTFIEKQLYSTVFKRNRVAFKRYIELKDNLPQDVDVQLDFELAIRKRLEKKTWTQIEEFNPFKSLTLPSQQIEESSIVTEIKIPDLDFHLDEDDKEWKEIEDDIDNFHTKEVYYELSDEFDETETPPVREEDDSSQTEDFEET